MNFTHKINWKTIFIHFVGALFIVKAMIHFVYLNDLSLLNFIDKLGFENGKKNINSLQNSNEKISFYLIWISLGSFIGIFISFLSSILINIINKKSWINSIILLIILLSLNKLGIFNSEIYKMLIFKFENFSLTFIIFFEGLIFFFVGLIFVWFNNIFKIFKKWNF